MRARIAQRQKRHLGQMSHTSCFLRAILCGMVAFARNVHAMCSTAAPSHLDKRRRRLIGRGMEISARTKNTEHTATTLRTKCQSEEFGRHGDRFALGLEQCQVNTHSCLHNFLRVFVV